MMIYPAKLHIFDSSHLYVMSISLLIGNSCSGKSTLSRILNEKPGIRSFMLDHCVLILNNAPNLEDFYLSMGEEGFCRKTYEAIQHLEKKFPRLTLVLDVGAGALQWPGSYELFKSFDLIHVKCEIEDFTERQIRRGGPLRTTDLINNFSYFAHKQKLFNIAKLTINTSLFSPQEAADMMVEYIEHSIKISEEP